MVREVKSLWKYLLPETLKRRLFAAFLGLILLPFMLLTVYLFREVESIMQEKMAERSHEQLQQLNQSFENILSDAYKTLILFEQDTEIQELLKNPPPDPSPAARHRIEEKFRSVSNSLFLLSPRVYFTLLDFHGHVYTSFPPKVPLNYDEIVQEPWYRDISQHSFERRWFNEDPNYVSVDLSSSPYLLSLFSLLSDELVQPYGVARISVDYSQWFNSAFRNNPGGQQYYLISRSGQRVAESGDGYLSESAIERIVGSANTTGYMIDEAGSTLINYSIIESVDWYLVNQIPLAVLYQEINELKNNVYVIFLLLTVAFIAITFLISGAITKPLYRLQKKMKLMVSGDFSFRLSEDKAKGEILDLTKAFNHMLENMDNLIQRLKLEERQKESVHFQMLLSQLNPHFLLNTLNIVKWLALRKNEQEIADICVSLGMLLETSLNSEIDLIPLREEIRLTESYMHIQRYKYKQAIELTYHYDEKLQFALVPKLSLQPLVENAVNHGFRKIERPGQIQIRAIPDGERLLLKVADNGSGIHSGKWEAKAHKGTGIGLRNLRERIRLLFRDRGSMDLVSSEQGTEVTIAIPLLLSIPYTEGGNAVVESADRGR